MQLGPARGSGVQRQTGAQSGSPRGEGGGPFTHLSARAASAAAATGHVPCGWTMRSQKAREDPQAKGCRVGSGKSPLTLRGHDAGQGLAVSTATTDHVPPSPCASVSS